MLGKQNRVQRTLFILGCLEYLIESHTGRPYLVSMRGWASLVPCMHDSLHNGRAHADRTGGQHACAWWGAGQGKLGAGRVGRKNRGDRGAASGKPGRGSGDTQAQAKGIKHQKSVQRFKGLKVQRDRGINF
jgi:hypothetical protein